MDEQLDQSYKPFIGVKLIEAYPCQKSTADGDVPGYNVKYQGGYEAWSPKDVFESAYFPLHVNNSLVQADIDKLHAIVQVQSLDEKTTMVKSQLGTGFVMYDTASCVDEANYDEQKGADIAMSKINSKLWFAMGFVLQWAMFGLKKINPETEIQRQS